MEKEAHVRFAEDENGGPIDAQNQALIQQAKTHKKKITHEEWIRSKEHQNTLREVLILEAKRDLYEKLMLKQAQQDEENERRAKAMYAWEENKNLQEALEKEKKLRQ